MHENASLLLVDVGGVRPLMAIATSAPAPLTVPFAGCICGARGSVSGKRRHVTSVRSQGVTCLSRPTLFR